MMIQTFGAGCAARVEIGQDSDSAGQEATGADIPGEEGSVASVGSGDGSVASVGSGDGGWGEDAGTGGGGPAPVAARAIALFRSQLPEVSGGSGSSSTASGGPALDPDDLFIKIGNRELSCADPYGDYSCGTWTVSIGIPPALQVPGVINLDAPELISYQSFTGPDRGGGDCYGGGGSFIEGTIEIVSIDAARVVVRLSDTDTYEFDANGEYTALRCP
ncbi:hypothetical protein WMF30_15900 [Sorangium sp. So ce134]